MDNLTYGAEMALPNTGTYVVDLIFNVTTSDIEHKFWTIFFHIGRHFIFVGQCFDALLNQGS